MIYTPVASRAGCQTLWKLPEVFQPVSLGVHAVHGMFLFHKQSFLSKCSLYSLGFFFSVFLERVLTSLTFFGAQNAQRDPCLCTKLTHLKASCCRCSCVVKLHRLEASQASLNDTGSCFPLSSRSAALVMRKPEPSQSWRNVIGMKLRSKEKQPPPSPLPLICKRDRLRCGLLCEQRCHSTLQF